MKMDKKAPCKVVIRDLQGCGCERVEAGILECKRTIKKAKRLSA